MRTRLKTPAAAENAEPRKAIMNSPNNAGHDAVVVAIDESDSCLAALAWAATYARNVGAQLQAVNVRPYEFGAPLVWAPSMVASTPPNYVDPEIELLMARLGTLFQSVAPEPSWTVSLLTGAAGQQLVHYARDAQVLVMGTREHQGLGRLLVGSVSHYCLNHALCPIVVVPVEVAKSSSNTGALSTPSGAPA